MAIPYIGNDDYLAIDGVDMSEFRGDIEYNPTQAATDVTIGSGNDWGLTGEGMKKVEMSIFLAYPTDPLDIPKVLAAVTPGRHTVVWGPQGNAAGLPKFQCEMIFTAAPVGAPIKKDSIRGFQIAAVNAGIPTHLIGVDTF